MIRCSSVAPQMITLQPGDEVIAGCELIDGTIFIGGTKQGVCSLQGDMYNTQESCESHGGVWTSDAICVGGQEVSSPLFVDEGDLCAYAGENGATVIWPETGNDVFRFGPGEDVPVGTEIHQGEVFDNGGWHSAPYTVTGEGAVAGPETEIPAEDITADGDGSMGADDGSATIGSVPPSDQPDGFCDPMGILSSSLPSEEEKKLLIDLANLQLPELPNYNLPGFTAYLSKLVSPDSFITYSSIKKLPLHSVDFFDNII